MKRNFDEQILELDGTAVRIGASVEAIARAMQSIWPSLSTEQQKEYAAAVEREMGKPLTLGAVCIGALLSVYQGEENLDDSARLNRMELARKINRGGVLNIEPAERDLVKPLLKKKYAGSILIPVVAAEMLETEAKEE